MAALDAETRRVRGILDREAPKYDRQMEFWERFLFGDGRRWVCSQARGDVLEVAAGTGRNLPFYSPDVRLTCVELSPEMLARAERRAEAIGRAVDLRLGDAQALDLPSAAYDTVVITLGLCTIPDDRQAIREAHRVLRPGGRLVLLEHVRSPVRPLRAFQRLIDPCTVRFAGDHVLRDPLDHLVTEGFEVERVERSKAGLVERVAARKPGSR